MILRRTSGLRLLSTLLDGLAVIGTSGLAADVPLRYREQTLDVAGERRIVRVPDGYMLEVLADDLDEPRLLEFTPNGDLFIGSSSGEVYRLPPPYTDPTVLVELDDYPHSIAFREGEMLIAQNHGLYRAPYRAGEARIDADDVKLLAKLPGGAGHSSRTVRVGPDGRVYVSLGISGNCSDQYLGKGYPFEDRRGGVLVLNEGGQAPTWEAYASGLRNPVGFDWQPGTSGLYVSNNGPDHWGYDLPPEYFSRAEPNSFHGMPWFQYDGEQVRRDDCTGRSPPRPRGEVTPPVATFPARSAPMGVAFVPKDAMTLALVGDAIVALHGSWAILPAGGAGGDPATQRSPKIVVVRFEDGEAQRVDDLVTGFQLPNGKRWARPVGVAIGPDRALYFTSDEGTSSGLLRYFVGGNGAVFRLRPSATAAE